MNVFVELRERAADKSNACGKKIKGDVRKLLAAVEDGIWFTCIADFVAAGDFLPSEETQFDEWSDVFRDLLRARAAGLVEHVGADSWRLTENGAEQLAILEAKRPAPVQTELW